MTAAVTIVNGDKNPETVAAGGDNSSMETVRRFHCLSVPYVQIGDEKKR
jgi:hypothetical protein